jgi:hypothetical protein
MKTAYSLQLTCLPARQAAYRICLVLLSILLPFFSHAAGLTNPIKATSLEQLVVDILNLVIRIGSIVLVFMIIWAGAQFVFAQGKPEKIKEWRNGLMWILIGGVILLGAQVIALGIKATIDEITNGTTGALEMPPYL